MIEQQAKQIEMQQVNAQKKQAEKEGKDIKISKAAKALNNAELGLDQNAKIETGKDQDILPISSDQMYTNFGETDEKTLKNLSQQKEAAAITMAKQAVSQIVRKHPETTQFPDLNSIKKSDKQNLELELDETADFKS